MVKHLPYLAIFLILSSPFRLLADNEITSSNQGTSINKNRVPACACWQTRDNTWSVAAFDGSGVSGGPGLPPYYRNDDWSTDTINLPFIFCFYGDTVNQVFINNNGNVSIGSSYSTFTALSFPDPTYKMVAPFWSDVDTRDSVLSGIVYYKLASRYLIIQWDSVGYFNTHADKRNTYQLIISDGTSGILPENKNVGFCYKTMEWTTGDASGGANGFGGTPATVGVNYGNGIDYVQIGLFDNAGLIYDGPYGNNDGVATLTNQSFVFNVCVNNYNVPPILRGDYICDTIPICVGDTFSYQANFIAPEQAQTTTVTMNSHGLSGANLLSNPGNQASLFLSFVAPSPGLYTIDIIGTDNGTPAASTTNSLLFNVTTCSVGIPENMINAEIISPNPVQNELHLSLKDTGASVTVTDLSGKIIYAGEMTGKNTIDTRNWQAGMYFVNILSERGVQSNKIIKN